MISRGASSGLSVTTISGDMSPCRGRAALHYSEFTCLRDGIRLISTVEMRHMAPCQSNKRCRKAADAGETQAMDEMIAVRHLSKRFGPITAVDDVSFTVARGEVLGFLGPNGAGKSTTMKMIAGFLAPTSGQALVCGHDVVEEPLAAKRVLGYLPEGAPSYGEMTPRQFLHFVADVRGLTGPRRAQRLDDVIERLHLNGVLEQPIETLSKGFKRRVGLAQAILHDPAVLILDEPTDGLDPNQKHEVRTLINAMAKDKTIVVSN